MAKAVRSVTEREVGVIAATQASLPGPRYAAVARAASHWGEHSAGWVAVAVVGAAVHPRNRSLWLRAGAAALTAHAAAVVLKRVVRRQRPTSPRVTVAVRAPSQLSFPSAHAASTTAFVLTAAPAVPPSLGGWVILGMALTRVLLGVHYPTDVAAGVALGFGISRTVPAALRLLRLAPTSPVRARG